MIMQCVLVNTQQANIRVKHNDFSSSRSEHDHSFPPAVSTESNPSPWTTEEQKLLEQALKTFPVNTPERWEKISDAVPGRSKKDCMKRYKV